jgi:hypothetical protein
VQKNPFGRSDTTERQMGLMRPKNNQDAVEKL